MTTLPPGLTQISEAEALRLLGSKTPGLVAMYVGHDEWCTFFRTNRPTDCNCNPTTEYYRVAKPKARAR